MLKGVDWGLCVPYHTDMKREAIKMYLDSDMVVWLKRESMKSRVSMAAVVRSLILEKMVLQSDIGDFYHEK